MNGNIWIATDHGGINILDKRLDRMRYIRNNPFNQTSLSQNSVICLYRDDTGIMWAGTYKNGINYYHESIFKFQTIRYPLELMRDIFNNDFNCIVEDVTIGKPGSMSATGRDGKARTLSPAMS